MPYSRQPFEHAALNHQGVTVRQRWLTGVRRGRATLQHGHIGIAHNGEAAAKAHNRRHATGRPDGGGVDFLRVEAGKNVTRKKRLQPGADAAAAQPSVLIQRQPAFHALVGEVRLCLLFLRKLRFQYVPLFHPDAPSLGNGVAEAQLAGLTQNFIGV